MVGSTVEAASQKTRNAQENVQTAGELEITSVIVRVSHRHLFKLSSPRWQVVAILALHVCICTIKTLLFIGEREIQSLRVRCDNLDSGCEWIGDLRSLDRHIQKCDFTLLPCTNDCKEGEIFRVDLEYHLVYCCPRRQHPCPHCNESGDYQERTTTHLNTCPKLKAPCPNDQCGASIPRCEVTDHRSVCEYERVTCKYTEFGCKEKLLRKDLKTHEEDDQLHLRLTTETVLKMKQSQESLLKHTNRSPFTFRMTDFSKHKQDNVRFYSPGFYTSPNGYKLCICVDGNGCGVGMDNHVSVFAYLMRGDNDDSLTWPFTGTVKIELLNQLKDKNHYNGDAISFMDSDFGQRVVNGDRGLGYGWQEFISHKIS